MHTPTGTSLKRRVFQAGAWSLAGHGLTLTLRFASNLLLTRLLAPEIFGVIAIGNIVISGLLLFSDLGVDLNIVRSPRGNDRSFLNTAWAVQILRGCTLCCIGVCVGMGLMALQHVQIMPSNGVYADPALPAVIIALSFNALSLGLTSTRVAEAARKIAVARVVTMEILSQVTGLICMLFWLTLDRSIWALVVGSVVQYAARTVLSHVWLRGTSNRWHWDKEAIAELLRFGKWTFLSSIVAFLAANCDRLILGALVDASVLGIYSIAVMIFSLVEQLLTRVIGSSAYPALSEVVRDRPTDLRTSLYKLYVIIGASSYFLSGLLIVSGGQLIAFLYDDRYDQAGWMLRLLAVGLLATPLQMFVQCFTALGFPQVNFWIILNRLGGLLFALPFGYWSFGTAGALAGAVISNFLGLPTILLYGWKHGVMDWRRLLQITPAIAAGMVAGLALNATIGVVKGLFLRL